MASETSGKSSGRRAWLPRRRRIWLIGLIAIGVGVGLWAAFALTGPVPVTLAKVTRGPAVQAVYATGVVEPVYWAKVAPTIVERIAEVIKRDGDPVKRGDILARLDDREAKANLARLEAAAKFTKEELERYEELARRNIASRQIFERARRDYIQAISAVAAAKERLNDYVLVSPLDGIVLRHDGEVGETVKPGDIVFWVGKRLPLRIIAEVDEEDIPLVRRGQKALLSADAFAKLVFGGTVKEITPKGDPINKNYRVRITVPDNTPLQIGMTTEVNIVIREEKNALLMPFTALRDNAVFLVERGRAKRRPVKIGIVGDRLVQIKSGLKAGQRVIAKPPEGLEDGDRVKVARPKPAS